MDQDLISSAKNKKTGGKMSYKRILNYEAQAPDPEDLTDRFSLFIQCRGGGITQWTKISLDEALDNVSVWLLILCNPWCTPDTA